MSLVFFLTLCCGCCLAVDQEMETAAEAVNSAEHREVAPPKPRVKRHVSAFAEAFLVASALGVAYEDAVGVLRQMVDSEDLRTSIAKVEDLVSDGSGLQLKNIDQFLKIVKKICESQTESANSQEVDQIEISLADAYETVAKELNAYIVDENP
jgi:hypothetical protein